MNLVQCVPSVFLVIVVVTNAQAQLFNTQAQFVQRNEVAFDEGIDEELDVLLSTSSMTAEDTVTTYNSTTSTSTSTRTNASTSNTTSNRSSSSNSTGTPATSRWDCRIRQTFDPTKHQRKYTIGVLAIRGFESAYMEFNKTFHEYLTATAGQRFDPPITFEMVPLSFLGVFNITDLGLIDFIYSNPSLFSCLESEHEAQSIVSQISRRKISGNVYDLNKFGGVIAARRDNDQIQSIHDIKGKIVAAASLIGLGSGQMQFKQMIDAGMSYMDDPAQLVFTENQNKVVLGVLNGEFDVGFIRTDQIERTKDGNGTLIDPTLLKVIDSKPGLHIDNIPFPFQSSTELYPEWNVAALKHVHPDVQREVSFALLSIAQHGALGDAIQKCYDTHVNDTTSYCDQTLTFPHDFLTQYDQQHNPARGCDSSRQIATLAREAMTNGKFSGWRTPLSYMQLRSMQEATGFIAYEKDQMAWRCVRMMELYDGITCPSGSLKKTKDEVNNGCAIAGLECKEEYTCVCNPCYQPLVCETGFVQVANRCMSFGVMFASIVVPVGIVLAILVRSYVNYKRRMADVVWRIQPEDLKFDDPPSVIGRGTFGLVVLAEYRGTSVAVKRVIPKSHTSSRSRRAYKKKRSNLSSSHDEYFFRHTTADSTSHSGGDSRNIRGSMSVHSSSISDSLEDIESVGTSVLEPPKNATIHVSNRFLLQAGNFASLFSVKSVKKKEHKELRNDFINEMRDLSKLRHPCITTVMGAVIGKNIEPMLVMEYMEYGSLYDLLHNQTMVIEGEIVLPILRDIARGLRFLHMANPQVIHGDLKSQNILVDNKFHAKVADFGLSQKRRVGVSGTTYWMAPELLRGESYNTAESDVYSFGIVLYELYSRKEPYEGEDHDEVLRQVCHTKINKRPPVPESCPPKIEKLMTDCISGTPSERPTATDIDLLLKLSDVSVVEPKSLPSNFLDHGLHMGPMSNRRSSMVLNDIFPAHIAKSLTQGRKVEPESHDLVTILFIDIVGFTTISGSIAPMKVSQMLDRLFMAFDRLATKHRVFKIETAGDAYMGVTNLVHPQPTDHVKRIANFAIEAIQAANETLIDVDDPERGCISIRVGLHSGSVVSNVVGSLNPKYGIFGDAVNITARMESTSIKNKIQCTKRTAALLMEQAPDIPLTLRGSISVKGKGEMVTYWVNETEAPEEPPAAGLKTSKHDSYSKRAKREKRDYDSNKEKHDSYSNSERSKEKSKEISDRKLPPEDMA